MLFGLKDKCLALSQPTGISEVYKILIRHLDELLDNERRPLLLMGIYCSWASQEVLSKIGQNAIGLQVRFNDVVVCTDQEVVLAI